MTLTIPRHWRFVDIAGLLILALVLLVPSARAPWLLNVVYGLCMYSAFWGLVDLYQRGLLTKRVEQICEVVTQSPRRTRPEHVAFILAGALLAPWYR